MQLKIKVPTEALTPEAITSYLFSKGWAKTNSWHVNNNPVLPVHQFRKEAPDRLPWEINLPMTRKIADYESCVYQAIVYLSKVEDRTEYEIYQDLIAGKE